MTEYTDAVIQLRVWLQDREYEKVIEEVSSPRTPGSPWEKTILCLALALSGREEARPMMADVTMLEPVDSHACSDVGLVCLLAGELDKSLRLLKTAVAASDATAVEYGRLATVYMHMEDLDKARENFEEAILREPGRAEWHNNLGSILLQQEQFNLAIMNFDTAIRLKPELSQAHSGRLKAMAALDRIEEVIQDIEAALSQAPRDVTLRIRLSGIYLLSNNVTQAINVLQRPLIPVSKIEIPDNAKEMSFTEKENSIRGQQIKLRMALADLFYNRARYKAVLDVVKDVVALVPETLVPCHFLRARALCELGRYDEAMAEVDMVDDCLLTADARVGEGEPRGLRLSRDRLRAAIYSEKGAYGEAEKILGRLLETYAGDAGLLMQLGAVFMWTGKLSEAGDCFEKASEINPMAFAQMVTAKRLPDDPESLKKMCRIADSPAFDKSARAAMSYALSTLFDRKNQLDRAWKYLADANALINEKLDYVPVAFTSKIDLYRKVFTHSFFVNLEPLAKMQRMPVFIVGMPRSGTTLTEQILASHPDIYGAGELDLVARTQNYLQQQMGINSSYAVALDRITPEMRLKASQFYMEGLSVYDAKHLFVVDKLPHNFTQLGLIAMLLPHARVIHIRRDPRDTALSNFQQNYKAMHGGMGFAYDLENIACQINDYHAVMAHWREVLPIPMFEIRYEDLVSDQDFWSEKMLNFLGVPWDARVHDFHSTDRAVRTASVAQVRQPIYKTSLQKWRRYEKYLSKLLENLDKDVVRDWD